MLSVFLSSLPFLEWKSEQAWLGGLEKYCGEVHTCIRSIEGSWKRRSAWPKYLTLSEGENVLRMMRARLGKNLIKNGEGEVRKAQSVGLECNS